MRVLRQVPYAVVLAFALAIIGLRFAGYTMLVITGGSMEPTIQKGSVVVVEASAPTAVAVGDVITFIHYGQTTTHRVTAIESTPEGLAFTTKGDANAVADPEAKIFPNQVGLVRAAVPFIGYGLVYGRAYAWIVLAVAAAVTLAISSSQVLRALRPRPAPSGSRP